MFGQKYYIKVSLKDIGGALLVLLLSIVIKIMLILVKISIDLVNKNLLLVLVYSNLTPVGIWGQTRVNHITQTVSKKFNFQT